jgi:hypothetical protein
MASDNVFLTALGNGSQVPITGTNRGGGTGDENPVARLRSTLTKLLGGDDSLTMTTSQAVDLDAYQGPPRAAMGLQVAVSGRATVVNADVAQHLIEYQDPIVRCPAGAPSAVPSVPAHAHPSATEIRAQRERAPRQSVFTRPIPPTGSVPRCSH